MENLKNVFYLYATISVDGFVLEIGGKALEASKIQPDELLGQRFSDLIFWQQNESISKKIADSIQLSGEGKALELETSLRINSSTFSSIKANFAPIINKQNQVGEIFFSSIDITQYTKEISYYKTQSERFLFAAECAEVGLWFWDLHTGDIFTTPQCNEIYGYPPNEIMIFDKFARVFHPEDIPKINEAITESQTNLAPYEIEYRIVLDTGEIRWLSLRGKTVSESENSWIMMGSVRDITQRKMVEDRLQQLVIIEKTAKEEIEEANHAKDNFMALVSHELRSPLNSILGWTKILLSKKVDQDTQQNALETIEKSAKFQAKMISDLVDSSKIISGKMSLSLYPLTLSELVSGVFNSQKPLAIDKNINFVLTEMQNLTISGDTKRLQQVFTNLITNSIKFTPEGGEILIELSKDNNEAVFKIKDSGPGITQEDLESVFKQYYQGNGTSKKEGLGLGLSIVKAIVEKHGGLVSVINNKNGVGCTFTVRLPIDISNNMAVCKEAEFDQVSAKSLENINILIVEDNEDSREVLHFYLAQIGAIVHSVSSVRKALEYLNSTKQLPHVIISDISMPEEDGYSFISKVRNFPPEKGRDIPAIALTAFASSNDPKKSLDSGFQRHHTKPFEPDLLVNEIIEVISRETKGSEV